MGLFDFLQPVLDGAHRDLPDPDQPVGVRAAIFDHPAIISVETRLGVIDVRVAMQEHADGREDHLGIDAVLILHIQPGGGVEGGGIDVFPGDLLAQILQRAPGADRAAITHREHAVDHQGRAQFRRRHLIGNAVAEFRVDIEERGLALHHMRIRGNQYFRQHGDLPHIGVFCNPSLGSDGLEVNHEVYGRVPRDQLREGGQIARDGQLYATACGSGGYARGWAKITPPRSGPPGS